MFNNPQLLSRVLNNLLHLGAEQLGQISHLGELLVLLFLTLIEISEIILYH